MEQLGPEFVAEHQRWVVATAGYHASIRRLSRQDAEQTVWEALISAHRSFQPGKQSLYGWALSKVFDSLDKLEQDGSGIRVPSRTKRRYLALMEESGWDFEEALQLAKDRKRSISPGTLSAAHRARQDMLEFDHRVEAQLDGVTDPDVKERLLMELFEDRWRGEPGKKLA